MSVRTFEQWSNAGFLIKKGSKASSRAKDGTAMFDDTQVQKKPTSSFRRIYGGHAPDQPDQCLGWGAGTDSFPDDDIPF